jgi:probable rRNA maturation factor
LFIHISNRQKDLKIYKSSLRALVEATLSHLKIGCEEVSLYLVTRKEICRLHDEFFQDPTPTDCISFPIDDAHLGEVFVCPSTAIDYAKNHHGDPHDETALYCIHGLLHLIGYDDLEPKAKRIMRKKEKSCMDHLKRQGISLRNPC